MTTNNIERSIGRLEGKVDGVITRLAQLEATTAQIETRTRGLENWRWKVAGIAAGISAFFTYLGASLMGIGR